MIRKKSCGSCQCSIKLKDWTLCECKDMRIGSGKHGCKDWKGIKYDRKKEKKIIFSTTPWVVFSDDWNK